MNAASKPSGDAGLTKVVSGLLSSVSGIALASALLAAAGAPGAHAQSDPTFDRFVVVQPIMVCNDDGSNCSVVNTFHAGTAKALGQANVLPLFLPLQLPANQHNDTGDNTDNDGPGSFNDGDGGSNDPNVINMWFTGLSSINDCGGQTAVGCASTPGRETVIDAQALINEAVGNGNHPYHRTIAHEMGHNFGLPHIDGTDPTNDFNLMEVPANNPRSGFYDEIGVTRMLLNGDQINTIRGSGLLQDPDDYNGGEGVDVVNVLPGTAYQNIFGNGGDDSITLNAGSGVLANVQGGAGMDTVTLVSGSIVGANVSGGADQDTLTIGGIVLQNVLGDEGDDIITVTSTAQVVRGVDGGSDNDIITIAGAVTADLPIVPLPPGVVTVPSPTQVKGGLGADTITITEPAIIMGSVFGDNNNADETGHGNDSILMSGGRVAGDILGEGGDDTITITGGTVSQFTDGQGGPTLGGNVLGGSGADTMLLSGGTIAGNVDGGSGDDTITVATDPANIFGGTGNDVITLNAGTVVTFSVFGDDGDGNEGNGDGNDTIVMTGGSVGANIAGEGGIDHITISGGSIGGSVLGGGGADVIALNAGGTITGNIDGGADGDTITINGGSVAGVLGGTGVDLITLNNGTITGNIDGGADGDTITINGGSVANVLGGTGADLITLTNGTITASLDGGADGDTITVQGGSVGNSVLGGAGADRITLLAGTIGGNVEGGDDGDDISIQGNSVVINNHVLGGAGADHITLLAGTIGGDLDGGGDGDTINIEGGSVNRVLGGAGDDRGFWNGGTIATAVDMGSGTDALDIRGVNAGGTALQAGLALLDGGAGPGDTLNLRGVVEVLTPGVQGWEFINLLNTSIVDLGPVSRTIVTELVSIEQGSTLVAQSPAGGQTYVIDGSLNNAGHVNMQSGAARYDELSVTNAYTGSGPLARLSVDTFLGAYGSPSDLMRVGPGGTAGETGIVVHDTNPGPGVYNPIGIEVVRVEATPIQTAKEHFFLVGGPIQKDLWIWDLALDDTRSNPGRANADVHVLYSRPTDIVQMTPYFGTGALTAFHSSLEPWVDRQHTLADTLARAGLHTDAPSRYVDLWVAPFGARRVEDSVSKLTFFGDTFTSQMDYTQNTYGVQAGVDVISKLGNGSAIMAGAFGGFLNSSLTPNTVPVRGEYEGGSVGAYASYVYGNLMLSAVFKADLLGFDWRAPTLDLKASADVDTYGGRLEAAYKHYLTPAGTSWLEPYANLTYAKSYWDQFTVLETTFDISDNESLLGRLGLRAGADLRSNQNLFKVFAGAGLAYEFNERNTADILSGGFTLPLTHKVDTTSLELQGGVKWTDLDKGLSLSITSSGRFSEDAQEYGGKATLNVQF